MARSWGTRKSNNIPVRHHFIPKMHQKRLADANGYLYRFDKRFPEKGVFRTTPKNNFVERHLYDQHDDDGKVETSAEDILAVLDGKSNAVIHKIVEHARSDKLPDLSIDEMTMWNLYYYTLFKRTSDAMLRMELTDGQITEIISRVIVEHQVSEGATVTQQERENLLGPKMRQTAKVRGILQVGEAFQVISDHGLDIADIRASSGCLVIGDNPIINFNLCKPARVLLPTLEGWLPVAHDVAVRPSFTRSEGISMYTKDEEFINLLNRLMIRQSTTIVGRSREVVEALA